MHSCPDSKPAARGNTACVELLLRYGANVHSVSSGPEATQAIHEATARSHSGVVDVLLRYGANPFVENGRGMTSVDLAIVSKNVGLLRRLEQQARFAGWLTMKVPRYLGLGAEWKARWVVIMPRYPHPAVPAPDQVVRTLLVCYKPVDPGSAASGKGAGPSCKCWLDGARARLVTGSQGSRIMQCALSLHHSHGPPSGAHATGEPGSVTLHLRPVDPSPGAAEVLRRFMQVCADSQPRSQPGPPAAGPLPQGGLPLIQPAMRPSATPYAPAASDLIPAHAPPPAPAHPSTSHTGETDEELARRLQAQYDAEAAGTLLDHADGANLSQLAGQLFAPHKTTIAAPLPAQPAASVPSAPFAPMPGPFPGLVPPPAASQAAVQDDDDDLCVICLEKPCEAGFVHGNSVHKCCCKACAEDLQGKLAGCPVCRQRIDHVILNFY
ncbi:hypothetical protein WJX72_002286 [[Myrmecia] bisecta]|uniref:Uncharacterized protein n=1 Tax=[Myrmecia] bisecta TaxID=41462 RepID=A0AAW1Q6P8_9CHLO